MWLFQITLEYEKSYAICLRSTEAVKIVECQTQDSHYALTLLPLS